MVHTRLDSTFRVRVKLKFTILLECSDLYPTDCSASVKGIIIRRY